MGCAPIAHALWGSVMNYDPKNPKWYNRDRFILSNGHASALLYSMLYLTGYDMTLDDLKSFRQLGSRTPGHPESELVGVEVTTGPLGQGVSNAVGMAIAESHLAALFNKPDFPVIDNYIYALCGDGCLEEGISHESASLAGHLKLGRLIVLYDDNQITIDGRTDISFSEDTLQRYEAYGWDVSRVANGDHDVDAILAAIERAKAVEDKPSIIAIRTTIGFGAAKQNTSAVHGAPLGWEDVDQVRAQFGFPAGEYFSVAEDVLQYYRAAGERGSAKAAAWAKLFEAYGAAFPAEHAELVRRMEGKLKGDITAVLPEMGGKDVATRSSSGVVLNALAAQYPELVGGSADLTPSNNTALKGSEDYSATNRAGRYLRFGVREHGMAAICNGMYAYGGFLPFCATFFVFVGYCMGAVRIAALSHYRVLFILTHDSIGVGEDGPTHQPIEQLWQLRNTPGITVLRPADGREVAGAYKQYMEGSGPVVLVLSRQNLPYLEGSSPEKVEKGAYVIREVEGKPDLVLVGTGSEVSMCVAAAQKMEGKKVRVVSMPSVELFEKQPLEYQKAVLGENVPIMGVEAGATHGWEKFTHYQMGMTTFGASAPAAKVFEHFGLTVEKVVEKGEKLMNYYATHPIPAKLEDFGF